MSADAEAAGLTTSSVTTGTSAASIQSSDDSFLFPHEAMVGSTDSGSSSPTSSSSSESSDHTHSAAEFGNYYYRGHGHGESSHSGTFLSDNTSGDTGGSNSHGTSERSGKASLLSTVSIELKENLTYFANNITSDNDSVNDSSVTTTIEILTVSDAAGDNKFGKLGGVQWEGDADNEYIFGTSWLDKLYGSDGHDIIYGFEGDDMIEGGAGSDRLFGDGGDDILESGTNTGELGGDVLSGGSGNDRMYGTDSVQTFFGGPGHDFV